MTEKEQSSIAAELSEAGARADQKTATDKKNYAERLSRALATKFANLLRRDFPGITPDANGKRQEAPARTSKGVKKLDVNYSTPELGLGLGVSIKTINFRDLKTNRYTKNYTRVDNELRAEAMDYHARQPFAVLAAVIFLPLDSCMDGAEGTPSSFGQAVKIFRNRSGRASARDDAELLERVFIGLYTPEGGDMGNATFFDVMDTPKKQGLPSAERLRTLDAMIDEIRATYDARNSPDFRWDT
jgi:hypothetical protein